MQTNDFGFNFDHSYARLPASLFSVVQPEPVPHPQVVILNDRLAESLGLNPEALRSGAGAALLSGNELPEWSLPLAQAYAGHQFGYFTMLGDGRAVLLGEQITPSGQRFDVQLKGTGRTPYSRGGDGRATIGPMLREYIISEAMHALGIPTTRSLAVVTTGEQVPRERDLPGAVLTRVAQSHLRVGTFQYAAVFAKEDLRALADYSLERHFPQLAQEENKYQALLGRVIKAQAELVAQWMLVGFIHGVMNTDNMAISGETIDYGPCAFMDTYDPKTVFSSIDQDGRYAYGNQPHIAAWNLARFAESLLPLLADNEEQAVQLANEELAQFAPLYNQFYLDGMRGKLGLTNREEGDSSLVEDLLKLMHEFQADYTNTFLDLTFGRFQASPLYQSDGFAAWKERWQDRLTRGQQSLELVQELMKQSNPAVIPRNHRVEEALRPAVSKGDYSLVDKLVRILADPFAHSAEQVEYAQPPEPSAVPYRTFCGT
ncbi:MAG: protein adenylyltransferase SelO [Limnochordia bacterium]|jgi:uncharacterized protein YdiU (UPF0061 family)